ncbi:hypothetical protein AB0H86_06255 [Streptomyces sp. NPDC050997]|uniref:hypothetical protein n=1 Tax=Streptomyces sp. NPDC050997 TaxID=3155519 RepID=UPI00342CF5EE
MAADPQTMIDQLKRPRREVLAPGVTGITLMLDVLMAPLIRALENLRMTEKRYNGQFLLPRYTSAAFNKVCLCDLSEHADMAGATQFLFTELGKVDEEIAANNKYGKDIAKNGVRIGGILFPLQISLPGQPVIGGFETADCYGRTYFIQESEGITAADVLEWLRNVPTDARELKDHPLQERRTDLLSVAGKVRAGNTHLKGLEELRLMRAVMPNTKIVLTVDGSVSMAEVRRRLVAQQHLDPPTAFTPDTEWQTRAEAVLEALEQKGYLTTVPGADARTVRQMIDNPKAAENAGRCPDEVAALAVSLLLRTPNKGPDRVITSALLTRGVAGRERSQARSELTAHVVGRAISDGIGREGRRSALERVLRMKELRDLDVDLRPIEDLIEDARSELRDADAERSKGTKPTIGPAVTQIIVRAAFYLTCGTGNEGPLLARSSHGAGKGEAQEPAELMRKLAITSHGLEQLVQAVLDGRQGQPVRLLDEHQTAKAMSSAVSEDEQLTGEKLRALALKQKPKIENPTAFAKVAEDTDDIRDSVTALEYNIEVMERRKDQNAGLPYIKDHGWADPHDSVAKLKEVTGRLEQWKMLHSVMNRNRFPETDAE